MPTQKTTEIFVNLCFMSHMLGGKDFTLQYRPSGVELYSILWITSVGKTMSPNADYLYSDI